MSEALRSSYDEITYPATPYPQTHPSRLSAIAKLMGMTPPNVRCSRVLEIGCADGSNLLPMAALYPDSQFIGIDLSANQLTNGRKLAERMNLTNIEFIDDDFTRCASELGSFDFIIAHGVYSWVPTEVADALLAFCGKRLSQNGVGYISYNTWPGWHPRASIRELTLRRLGKEPVLPTNLASIRRFIQGVRDASAAGVGAFPSLMVSSLDAMLAHPDSYWRHDLLEPEQHPVSFLTFHEQLRKHSLEYVGEAEFHSMLGRGIPGEALKQLQSLVSDIGELEQLMDLMVCRSFRQSIICHAGQPLDRTFNPERIQEMFITGLIERIDSSGAHWEFRSTRGLRFQRSDAEQQAVVEILARTFPSPIAMSDLAALVGRELNGEVDIPRVASTVLKLYSYDVADLQTTAPAVINVAAGRPIAFSLARTQAELGSTVTNLRHEHVELSPDERALVGKLDGTWEPTGPAQSRQLDGLIRKSLIHG